MLYKCYILLRPVFSVCLVAQRQVALVTQADILAIGVQRVQQVQRVQRMQRMQRMRRMYI